MLYLKRLGLGAVIWAAIFVAVSILVALKYTNPWLTYPFGWLITIILGWHFSKITKVSSFFDGFITGILFGLAALILDYFITTKYTGMELFSSWDIWVGYGLILAIPIIYGSKHRSWKFV